MLSLVVPVSTRSSGVVHATSNEVNVALEKSRLNPLLYPSILLSIFIFPL